jgi:hypothetical protein
MSMTKRELAPEGGPRAVHRLLRMSLWVSLSVVTLAIREGATLQPDRVLDGTSGARWAILVAGISGEPELRAELLKELTKLRAVLVETLGFRKDRLFLLSDAAASDPALNLVQPTMANLSRVCLEISRQAQPGDLVFIYIAGHGSSDDREYKLNLVGPDPTAEELAGLFYSIPARRFIIANTTSASGASLPALSREGEIVITATRSGSERNRTHLGAYFIEALADPASDADHNGRTSIVEAFTYAARKVAEYYAKEGSLQTEHPVLVDNGDSKAQARSAPEEGAWALARITYLDAGPPRITRERMSADEETLVRSARSLEEEIEVLKGAKARMPETEYEKRLEELFLRLAEINARLRKH